MKKSYILSVACAALFFCSCKKENFDSTITNSTTASKVSSKADASALQLVPGTTVNYGAMINPPDPQNNYVDFQVDVADQLGVSCVRVRALVPSDRPNPMMNTKYKLVLNFNLSDFGGKLLPFATDLVKYETDLRKTVALYTIKPVAAIIENEESNRFYYSGSAKEYINQLTTAVKVMHDNGIKVANGGLTNQGLNYLVYMDFINQGKYDSAQEFKTLANVTPNAPSTKNRGAFVDTLLQSYTQMDLDYINFHWKGTSPNTQTLTSVIAYLKKRTGKPVMSNEYGQFDTDPNTLLAQVQKATDEQFPYVLWYSPVENGGKKDTPLNHRNATLTSTGVAYQEYLRN